MNGAVRIEEIERLERRETRYRHIGQIVEDDLVLLRLKQCAVDGGNSYVMKQCVETKSKIMEKSKTSDDNASFKWR